MNPILTAMGAGYGVTQILQFVSRMNPALAQKVQQAITYGYPAAQILKFVFQGSKDFGISDKNPGRDLSSLYDKMQFSVQDEIANVGKAGLGLGAAGLGYLATRSLAGAAGQAAQQVAAPNVPPAPAQAAAPNTGTIGNVTPGQQVQQQAQAPVAQAMQPTNPAQVAQAAQAQPQNIFNQLLDGVNPSTLSPPQQQQLKFLSMISDELETKGKTLADPEFKNLAKKIKKTIQGKPGTVLEESARFEDAQKTQPAMIEANQMLEEKQQPQIKKADTVITPHGLGEVKALSGNDAIVEIDGKAHKLNENDLIASPLPEKDLADLYDDLIAGIEKTTGEDVSRMTDWAGYDPKTNTLAFLPHSGALYTYKNISPERAKLLTDVLSVRKTSGENFIGVWKKDSKSPIGAAMSKLIRELQAERGGKGNEYEEKFETIYKAFEPAILAKKKKKKKK